MADKAEVQVYHWLWKKVDKHGDKSYREALAESCARIQLPNQWSHAKHRELIEKHWPDDTSYQCATCGQELYPGKNRRERRALGKAWYT